MKAFKQLSYHTRRSIIILSLIALYGVFSGCFYYKVNRSEALTSESLSKMQDNGKYFIFHDGVTAWQMDNLKIENNILSGQINPLPTNRYNFSNTDPTKSIRYNHYKQSYILNEVHIYANFPVKQFGIAQIPFSFLEKIELYDPDKESTVGTWMLGFIGAAAGVALLVPGLHAASESATNSIFSSSCPFIFIYDGYKYNFAGETFGGAISPPLERDDYLKLWEIRPFENAYHILISNPAREIQNTNLAELYIIDHPKNTSVFIDNSGKIYTCLQIQKPSYAADANGNSLVQMLADADNVAYQSIPDSKKDNLMDEIILSFKVPKNCKEGKLVLRARNSLFLDYSIEKCLGLFGNKLPDWQERVSDKPAGNFKKWSIDQGIPLSVYLEKDGNWEFLNYFDTPGPMAFRDDILRINLEGLDAPEIKIKLKAGKLFWEIDRIGMDFSNDCVSNLSIVKPYRATNQDSLNVLDLILKDDKSYFIQPEIGNEAELLFPVPEIDKSNSRSVFLHSKGHYQILGNENEARSMSNLKKFLKPASFTNFARENYFKILEGKLN
jgi:hypothetical protein